MTGSTTSLRAKADASRSRDTDATPIKTYTFDFDDGSSPVTTTRPRRRHTYPSAGTYAVTLTVKDTAGLVSPPRTRRVSVSVPSPDDNPPVARLSTTGSTSSLTATADGSSSTDTDSTPIATYRFDFGDSTAAVTTSSASRQHTYAGGGTYTVTLTVTDTAGLVSDPVQKSVSVSVPPPPDNPPVAHLTVSHAAGSLVVTADASGSTDSDLTPISTFTFSFGDSTSSVTTSSTSVQHTYVTAGTYTVTLTAKDTAGKQSSPVSQSVTVSTSSGSGVAVYAGYYDTHHDSSSIPKPSPWQGSPGVVFVGQPDTSAGGWDSAAVRIDNLTGSTLTGVVVTVDIGSKRFALWGTNTVPAGQTLVLAQTGFELFDGSDRNPAGCYGCDPTLCLTDVLSTVPVVNVTYNGTTIHVSDTNQILNTKGADSAGCPYTGHRNDETEPWQKIG
jgi:large repetitive protein